MDLSTKGKKILKLTHDLHCVSEMDTTPKKILETPNKRLLSYTKTILKIPEYWKIDDNDLNLLPCVNTHSVVRIYESFFEILSALYVKKNLCNKVLLDIKLNRKYYENVISSYLKFKKLDLIEWLSRMLYQNILADEIWVYACAIFLNIHITVDYLHGFWTTLDLPDLNHDLAISLSEVHMAYHGLCKYSNLCHTMDLPTKGKRILKPKLEKIKLITTKHLKIKLTRVEEFNNTAASLLNTTSRILGNITPTSHESHAHISKELNVNNPNKDKSSREEPISLFNTESSDTRNATSLVLKEVTPESKLNKINMNKENTVKLGKEAMIKLHHVDDKIYTEKSINTERY